MFIKILNPSSKPVALGLEPQAVQKLMKKGRKEWRERRGSNP